jgi:RHS repeat-associated protein
VLALPKGGGAISGLGESFSPDLFTGTGNYAVPIPLPPGRRGLHPQLSLGYSTGNGNGVFGLGWGLNTPGVSRKTSKGVPRYGETSDGTAPDVFLLSGTEDLVLLTDTAANRVRYQPRTEGSFSRIEHVHEGGADVWEVRTPDGLVTRYGTLPPGPPDPAWRDPAVVSDPAHPGHIFGWRITSTVDLLGNLIRYEYDRDQGEIPGHRWDQPLLAAISYADYGDRADPSFLVTVEFEYESRPDAFSDYRAGFEIRTTQRCRTIRVVTNAADDVRRVWREYRLSYTAATFSGISQLTRFAAVGIDEAAAGPTEELLPPLAFTYTALDPAARRFTPVTGPALPQSGFSDPTVTLVDLGGTGQPDLVELGVVHRFWANRGGGEFAFPQLMQDAPTVDLADPGNALLDADGDGRADLVVTGSAGGYFPMSFGGGWSRRGFRPYAQVPSTSLADPQVRLADLDGDGLTDVLRSGPGLTCWFNDPDPRLAWQRSLTVTDGPDVDLADPRVRFADMTGDGMPDLVLVNTGNISFWPNLGHGRWGTQTTMARSPRFPIGFDIKRVLLGDVDGDGTADVVYADQGRVLLWANRQGTGYAAQPVIVPGTPTIADGDILQLTDLHGTGMAGILFSHLDATGPRLRFLDFTGGAKPYLLRSIDNGVGALTTIAYGSSTEQRRRDQPDVRTRWRTPLPVPVHVVTGVEVTDQISGGRLLNSYRYHHGYWDGTEREFRGFGMVEQLDTETFAEAVRRTQLAGSAPPQHHAPQLLTKTWFHLGPVAATETTDWTELDLTADYWPGDPDMLHRPDDLRAMLADLPRDAQRSALRAMRGRVLRTELYALDGDQRQDRPFTVTETLTGVREESPPADDATRARIFVPFPLGNRSTQWERGADPMTSVSFSGAYDAYGRATRRLVVAVPRGRDPRLPAAGSTPYLATYGTTEFARRDDDARYLVDREAAVTTYEVVNDGRMSVAALRDAVVGGAGTADFSLRLLSHTRSFYDGEAFVGLPLGQLGDHGLPVRTESLAVTDELLTELFPRGGEYSLPPYLDPAGPAWTADYPAEFRTGVPELAGYHHDTSGPVSGYYIVSERHRYDVHQPGRQARGLVVESLDPLGSSTLASYDEHDLLPVRSTNGLGLTQEAVNDYRVLMPRQLTDANGNIGRVEYSPGGFVTGHYVSGAADGPGGEQEGDRDEPSVRIELDLRAFGERGQPASVRTVQRLHHDTDHDIPAERRDEVIVSVSYSDGFGRIVQTRTQAEDTLAGDITVGGQLLPLDLSSPGGPVRLRRRSPDDPPNVAVSGWQIYDNKGRVVERYEPFFATGWDFSPAAEAQLGQKAVFAYDPRGRVVRTFDADGSEQRVIFGVPTDLAQPDAYAPTAWESYSYDANDNAGRTHGAAAETYRDSWDTPGSVEFDALGHTVLAVARTGSTTDPDARLTTRFAYDISGNLLSVTDAMGRVAFGYHYDLGGRCWRTDNLDAGRSYAIPDAVGAVVERRDAKAALTLSGFDVVHRPTHVWCRDAAGAPITLRQRIHYGDEGDRDAARAANLLGQLVRCYDEAGIAEIVAADFKGNVTETRRRLIADARILDTYAQAGADGWRVPQFRVDWTLAPGQSEEARDAFWLEPEWHVTSASFDALDRTTRHVLPADAEGRRRTFRPRYHSGGGLEALRLDGKTYLARACYDAAGRRVLAAYGNGLMTRHAYDPRSFGLARTRTESYRLSGNTFWPAGQVRQDLGYRYDQVGNLLTISDRTPGSGVPGNPQALGIADPALRALVGSGDALDREFRYDPLGRLVSATGREHAADLGAEPWIGAPRSSDPTLARAYAETYRYDALGNLLRVTHTGDGTWTRSYLSEAGRNRLQRLTVGHQNFGYGYDPCGNLQAEATTRHLGWDHANRLVSFAQQTEGAEPSVHVHYLYDSAGQRAMKVVRTGGGKIEVTRYVDPAFERHSWTANGQRAENTTIHVVDTGERLASVRVGPAHPDDRGPAVQFLLGDHLGSATIVTDGSGALVNTEEFTPYGDTSFGSFARKRYRFTGQERDDHSGLTYHSARHYACWLGRWVSADPAGVDAGDNPYAYCGGNPINFIDLSGLDGKKWSVENVGTENLYESAAMAIINGNLDVLSEQRFEELTRFQIGFNDVVATDWKASWSLEEHNQYAQADKAGQAAMRESKFAAFWQSRSSPTTRARSPSGTPT